MSLAPAPVVYRSTIAWGDDGVLETVAAMRQIVQDSMASPVLVETARELAHYGGPDPTNQARVIRHWLTQVFHFVSDPVKAEHTGTPAYLLGRLAQLGYISGDCDDAAVLGAALGMAVGIPATFTVLAFDDFDPPITGTRGELAALYRRTDPRYSHVFASLLTPNGRPIRLDITRPPGSVAPVVRSLTVAV